MAWRRHERTHTHTHTARANARAGRQKALERAGTHTHKPKRMGRRAPDVFATPRGAVSTEFAQDHCFSDFLGEQLTIQHIIELR